MLLQMFIGGSRSLLPQAPQLPGTLGATPSEGEPPKKRSFLDKLLGVYTSGNVSDEQAKEMRSQGLIEAGLAIMAASGQGSSTGEALYGGLQAGKAATAQQGASIQQQDMQDRLRAIGEADPAALPAMLQEAIASGADPQTINALSGAVNAIASGQQAAAAGQGSKAKGQVVDIDGRQVLIDMTTGEVLSELGETAPPRGVVVDTVDGKALVDPTTGRRIAVYEGAPEAPSQYSSEAASRLSQFRLARADIVTNLEALGRGPTWAEWKLYNSDAPGRGVISNEMQGLLQAQNLIVTQIAKELGGVRGAASKEFRNIIARTYLIAPGDRALNQEQTLQALEKMEQDLERKAGGIFDTSASDVAGMIEGTVDGFDVEPEGSGVVLDVEGLPDPSEY